ncbi:MAG: hypothetical protein LBH93_03435 [Chitinispirillales bacterium]|jgi:hypothetical protein|nr:hypothetical protein [Chitinispirillales bacterium]
MNLSKIKAIAAIAAVSSGAVFAQFNTPANARMNSLAGVPMRDISNVYSYPVLMAGYLEHIQATWDGGENGAVIGIKSVSDMFSIGVLANQGLMAPGLAGDALNYLNAAPGGGIGIDAENAVIPHILLGFDLGAVAIGADVFFEYAGYSASTQAADGAKTSYSGSYSNPGARLSARFGVADADILAKFGLGFPSINASGVASDPKIASDEGLYMEVGAEAGMPFGNADWTLGMNYTRSDQRFKNGNDLEPNAICYSLLRAYAGLEFNFVETAAAALSYSFDRYARTVTAPDASNNQSNSNPINHYHRLSAGVENAWENVWFFDSFQLRGGALYEILALNGSKASTSNPTTSSDASPPAAHQRVAPALGIGVTKAFFTLDAALNPGNWAGVFTGPQVAMATATVKF